MTAGRCRRSLRSLACGSRSRRRLWPGSVRRSVRLKLNGQFRGYSPLSRIRGARGAVCRRRRQACALAVARCPPRPVASSCLGSTWINSQSEHGGSAPRSKRSGSTPPAKRSDLGDHASRGVSAGGVLRRDRGLAAVPPTIVRTGDRSEDGLLVGPDGWAHRRGDRDRPCPSGVATPRCAGRSCAPLPSRPPPGSRLSTSPLSLDAASRSST